MKQLASYKTINSLKEKYPIKWLCDALGISRSSYYKWTNRVIPSSEIENLKKEILRIYNLSGGTYGYRRIYIYLRLFTEYQVNHKKVQRITQKYNIKALIRQKKKKYIRSTPETTALNVLNREFQQDKPNKVWLTDVTEFKLRNGKKVYLSAIYDLGSKKIISYEISQRNDNPLVFKTFNKAINKHDTEGIIFHSDRGFQYTNRNFNKKIQEAKMIQSMSRVSRCIDNGPMEGFWGLLKSEIFKSKKYIFDDFNQANKEIRNYINFFNGKRISLKMAALIQAQPSN
ncbi:IS3 family transposase [Macrococcoides caseolyticum]|nr:IS3 family transposase [Macrococcus caseolyticus]QPT47775.1 IS3 family transposase [Macrococcus caseolyticus]